VRHRKESLEENDQRTTEEEQAMSGKHPKKSSQPDRKPSRGKVPFGGFDHSPVGNPARTCGLAGAALNARIEKFDGSIVDFDVS
jgi:hypothetical protein